MSLLLSGCAGKSKPVPAPVVPPGVSVSIAADETALPTQWKTVILPDDAARIDTLNQTWSTALAEARDRRFAKAVEGEGELLDPAVALPRPAPPPGRYRCRIVRLGDAGGASLVFARFNPFFCFVEAEGALLTFTKSTGTRRPGGRLWDDGDRRMIFLGGVAERETDPTPAYGADPAQNRVGTLERVGEFRWRLTMLGQGNEERLEVIELVPDTPPPPSPQQTRR